MRIRVKFCGMTNVNDAAGAVETGADAIGLVFYEASPRFVSIREARKICRELPPFVSRVGVFVNAPADDIHRASAECGLDTLQFHGEETPEFCAQFKLRIIKAMAVRDESSIESLRRYAADAWLLDACVAGKPGGSGGRFDWDLAVAAAKFGRPIILAGGLSPDNAFEACERVRPFALDVSSGIEVRPGRKDLAKMSRFIQEVRRWEGAKSFDQPGLGVDAVGGVAPENFL